MSSPSDYWVRGPEDRQEVAKPVYVSHRDDHLPQPRPRGTGRRRRPRRPPPGSPPDWATPQAGDAAEAPPAPADGQDHAIDTLA
jgi:hypothetical protein